MLNFKFHLQEHREEPVRVGSGFTGRRNIFEDDRSVTIRSNKGTVRGVKNRVKAGVATFLQSGPSKVFSEREQGKVVVYVTSLGVIRETYQRCLKVIRILRTLMISFEERDVFMNKKYQRELTERTSGTCVDVPQVFVEGQLLGDAELIEKLNESGDLRRILTPYKRAGIDTPCATCGGYRFIPCLVCGGGKKSSLRRSFSVDFITLKCVNCDVAGLVCCPACSNSDC